MIPEGVAGAVQSGVAFRKLGRFELWLRTLHGLVNGSARILFLPTDNFKNER
jgi:hypothetical protein